MLRYSGRHGRGLFALAAALVLLLHHAAPGSADTNATHRAGTNHPHAGATAGGRRVVFVAETTAITPPAGALGLAAATHAVVFGARMEPGAPRLVYVMDVCAKPRQGFVCLLL